MTNNLTILMDQYLWVEPSDGDKSQVYRLCCVAKLLSPVFAL